MKDTTRKTAVLIMREDPHDEKHPHRMTELSGLAKAAGYEVMDEVTQSGGRDRRFQVGRGKIAEAMELMPEKLIFYNPLSPGQVYHISKEFGVPVIDRFNLILEIFAKRASTREAKLQVELAQLSYEAPFIRTMVSLRKLAEKPGYRGAGRYEESMYQDVRGRIAKIKVALASVEKMGEERRRRRREIGFDLVALAGYTNAGKSTLLNALADEKLPLYGDGMNVRDWIYVDDHSSAILAVLEKGSPGQVYNIGGGNERANVEITRFILETLGKSQDLIEFVKDRPGHDRRYAIDSSKIRRELGWAPSHSFEEALERTIKWYVENRRWWQRVKSGEYREYYRKQYGNR